MFDLFSSYYIGRLAEAIKEVPKEVVYAAAAYAAVHKIVDAATSVKVAQLQFETERLRLEIEILRKKNAQQDD